MAQSLLRAVPHELARLPVNKPFRVKDCALLDLKPEQISMWTEHGFLRRPLRGIYYRSDSAESLQLRIDCLKLMAPPTAVVTDRTAAWLQGAPMSLAPNDHLVVPRVSMFLNKPGNRLRNGAASSGERAFLTKDLIELDGLLVTSPLRTACDLGRLLTRDEALASMDSLHSLGAFSVAELTREMERFRRQRGVRQGRMLAPIVDGRAQSPGESATRLRWYDVGLPRPELQWPVPSPHGANYFLDLALPCCGFAVEFDGEAFHGDDQRTSDLARREWVRASAAPTLLVLRRTNVYGRHQDAQELIRAAVRDNPHQCAAHRYF